MLFLLDDQDTSANASSINESTSSGQQDWSAVWECFESPYRLLSMPAGGLSKGMQVISIYSLLKSNQYICDFFDEDYSY